MAATIQAVGDTIKIDKAFLSGKDRVAVNGQVVFEGKIAPNSPQSFTTAEREYVLEVRTLSKMTGAVSYHLNVRERGETVHTGIYDQLGKPVASEGQAKTTGAMQACGVAGGIAGFALMMFLNMATGVVPGGAVGGAIGGGVGYAIGFAMGSLILGERKE